MSFVYFTDRDLGRRFPAILRSHGLAVEEHHDHFAPSTSDEEWLTAVAKRDWVVITHDKRIRYKTNERAAVMRAGIQLLVVIGNVPYAELAVNFVRTIFRIESFVTVHERPFIAKVHRPSPADLRRDPNASGRIDLWLSHQEWQKRRLR